LLQAVVVGLVVDARFRFDSGDGGRSNPPHGRATSFAIDDESLLPPDARDGDASDGENVEVVHEFVRGARDDDGNNSD
jgi:hypothetical protein